MASGDVTTGGSSTTSANPDVQPTVSMLLKGLQGAYGGGVAAYDKPLYASPSNNTQSAWWHANNNADQLIAGGGMNDPMRTATGTFNSLGNTWGNANTDQGNKLGAAYSGYGQIGNSGGLSDIGRGSMIATDQLGGNYAGLYNAYDPNSAAYKTLRQGVVDDTLSNLGSQFTNSGRFGGGSYVDTASKGLGDALAGLDYTNMSNNINNQYRSLDSQRALHGDVFNMANTGTQNQLAALGGQAGTANSIFGNTATALGGAQSAASSLFNAGQTAIGNTNSAIAGKAAAGASEDADALARRMAEADLFDRTNNADWNTLGRASSILSGTAPSGGTNTSNTVPWWAALLGTAATGASIFG